MVLAVDNFGFRFPVLSFQFLAKPCANVTENRELKTGPIISFMAFLRFLMVLSLAVWIGGLIFFAFVLAPTAFSPGLLPSRQLAGLIVGRSLDGLHFIAIVSGIVFLIASMVYSRMATGNIRPLGARHVLIVLMLMLTVISQFGITPKMHAIRAEVGAIDNAPLDNPLRMEFDRLHAWSEHIEEVVLLLGLVALYTTAQALR
jgi:uncharacterized membrane protein